MQLSGLAGRATGGQASPIDWIQIGAHEEDDTISIRSSDHFYTVTPGRQAGQAPGLSDGSETFGLKWGGITNSFSWATDESVTGPFALGGLVPGEENIYRWSNARKYQYRALTYPNPADRTNYIAAMLCALGHALHLNQDLSQPEHTRNDQHVFHHCIERHGREVYLENANRNNFYDFFPLVLQGQGGWASYWKPRGFLQLLDFWDRGQYKGDPAVLNADADGSYKLGLAEFTSGNFLGQDAIYTNFFSPGDPHCFPRPSLTNTTQPRLKRGFSSPIRIDTITLENGKIGSNVYVSKVDAGIPIRCHSALHYLSALHAPKSDLPSMRYGLTINDSNVLHEYHSILIPKAIEYSTGILDYFFRGQLDVTATSSGGQYQLHIINRSAQDLKGGTFTLLHEDSSGTRATVPLAFTPSWDSSSALPDGQAVDAVFTGSFEPNDKFILVYRGTIGINASGGALDPVDKGLAIAAQSFAVGVPYAICNWDESLLANLQGNSSTLPAWNGVFDRAVPTYSTPLYYFAGRSIKSKAVSPDALQPPFNGCYSQLFYADYFNPPSWILLLQGSDSACGFPVAWYGVNQNANPDDASGTYAKLLSDGNQGPDKMVVVPLANGMPASCAQWSQLSWTPPTILGQASATFSAGAFHIHLATDGLGSAWVADTVGSLSYTGCGCQCQAMVTVNQVAGPGNLLLSNGFVIYQDGSPTAISHDFLKTSFSPHVLRGGSIFAF